MIKKGKNIKSRVERMLEEKDNKQGDEEEETRSKKETISLFISRNFRFWQSCVASVFAVRERL